MRIRLGPAKTHGKPEGNRGDFHETILSLVVLLGYYFLAHVKSPPYTLVSS